MAIQTPNLAYDTIGLIAVVPNLKKSSRFLLDKFFPAEQMSDTEFVAIDVDVGKRRMAPFVSPLVEGKLVEQRRMATNTFKPAYIKDKRAPDLRKPVRRMIGERIGGELTGEARQMANLNAELEDQIDILTRRLEWMAAQVLTTGTVVVAGDGFPTQLVDFGRDPSLTTALSGSAQWLAGNVVTSSGVPGPATPSANIEAWQHYVLKKSGGRVTDIVFTTSAWSAFLLDPLVKGAIYYPKLGDSGNMINPGAQIAPGAVYKGRWGQYDLWLYNEWAVDENDVEKPLIPDGMVVLSGSDMMGVRAFAQIIDPKFNYEAMPFAPKTWINEDPAQQFLMMQSAPLVIPGRVNAAMAIQVCPPAFG
ncbi:major capsid protein [Rhizosaccharibacter radicis]|uniref:Major capsid protein n=1 Tax=Rhizosaccharibacter radicis TaxID=2782605 RepID=A0ABT1VYR5_9PROT|nr:major capsid protein [Acetobacteraceae bacterium KSS12]